MPARARVGVLRTSCPASPSGEHHWTAWRKPVLLPDAEWTCGRCGAEISAPPDPSGCAPEWSWIQLEQLLAGGVEEAA